MQVICICNTCSASETWVQFCDFIGYVNGRVPTGRCTGALEFLLQVPVMFLFICARLLSSAYYVFDGDGDYWILHNPFLLSVGHDGARPKPAKY